MENTWKLKLRLFLAMAILFGIIYAILMVIGTLFLGGASFQLYAIIGIVIMIVQYLAGPKIVEISMGVKYVSEEKAPDLHRIIGDLAKIANIPKPKVGVSEINVPNAFAFGRTKSDGRVCITRGMLNILKEDEIRAVLGHEIAHIKHSDMIVMTVVSMIPMICYYIGMSFIFSRGNNENNNSALIGILALGAYFIGQLLVLFISRTREYYADQGSVEFGNSPDKLASALYKLVYGASKADKNEVKKFKGTSAFFLNDIGNTDFDIRELSQLDTDRDGNISASELSQLKYREIHVKTREKLMEVFSTHPNMLKRMRRLSEYLDNEKNLPKKPEKNLMTHI
ncbi:MAG: M48 family metalloprotease [Methanobrevibacter sp.]|nr:M48 family metalloprotease [Candidatus Methanovirga meridionalis]